MQIILVLPSIQKQTNTTKVIQINLILLIPPFLHYFKFQEGISHSLNSFSLSCRLKAYLKSMVRKGKGFFPTLKMHGTEMRRNTLFLFERLLFC